jgi:hypothetical protein
MAPLAVVVVLGGVLLALTLPGARADLIASKAALLTAQDDLGRGDLTGARASLAVAERRSRHADGRTHDLLWRSYRRFPVVGRAVGELQAMARAVHVTTEEVLPPLLDVNTQPAWSGRVDTEPFIRLQRPLTLAQRRLEAVRRQLRNAASSDIAQIDRPRRELDDGLTRLAASVGEARVATVVLPAMLDGDKRYLLAVQNTAEPRATGGLLGSYGLLAVHDGRFTLTRVGPNNDLHDSPRPVVDLGAEYDDRFSRFQTTSTWRSANLTADTPSAARILAGLWDAQFGGHLDGVLLVDPVALADILGATGPVTLEDGTRITEQNAVRVLLVDAYRMFTSRQNAERNAYLSSATRHVVERLRRPGLDGSRVLQRVAKAAGSGHLQAWSADPGLEAQLLQSRVGGALQADGPFLSVVTQDVGGSKLGAYLRRSVTYRGNPTGVATDLGSGPRFEEVADVTVALTNAAPAGLPPYVTARPDDPTAPVGQAKYWVSVYVGKEGTLLGATLDGRPLTLETGTERGLSVFSTFVTIDRGATRRLVVHLRQQSRPGQPMTYRQQPLLRPDVLVVRRHGAPLELVYAK